MIDHGLFPAFAERLARDAKVGYYSSWQNAFPVSREMAPGMGLEGVTRVNDPLRALELANVVAIPDLYHNDFESLSRGNQPTFGAGEGNRLETDRWFLKEFLTQHDLPVVKSVELDGTDDLRAFLEDKENTDKYIKVSVYRGDMETFHHIDWLQSQTWFEDLVRRLGPLGRQMRFIAEDPIPDALEVGIDGFYVGHQLLTPFAIGYEIKDAGYVGVVTDDIPEIMRSTMDALSEYFAETDYRCWFSNEMRITKDGTVFMTDATCRMPSPPGGVMLEAISNFTEVITTMARGKIAAPDFGKTAYLTEIVLKSDWVSEHWLEVRVPPRFANLVKLHNYCRIDGHLWVIPHDSQYSEFGSAIGYGDRKSVV